MDFKISDDIEEVTPKKKKNMSNGMKMVIVIIVSLVAGVSVFLISNYFFGEKTEAPITSEVVSLTDSNVQEAYSYVTYGPQGERYKKFVEEAGVSLESFTNDEKFMYAFMFSTKDDFITTGNKDENGLNIYSISNDTVNEYMQKFFGSTVTYDTNSEVKLVLDYSIDNSNMTTLKYDATSDSFLGTFTGVSEKSNNLISPYIAALAKATKKTDDTLELQERVVYTDLVKGTDNTYTLSIYKDFAKSSLLESVPNLTEESINQNTVNITNYYDKASIINYKFKKGEDGYYFVNSTITS